MALIAALGCSRSDIVPVSGRVTLDGEPLPGAVVVFQPVRDRGDSSGADNTATGSVGRTDASGRYRLQLVEPPRDGALVGSHIVTITTLPASAASATGAGDETLVPADDRVPEDWRDGSQRFEVPPQGTTAANFDLTSR